MLGFLIFTAYPMIASLYLSFTKYNIITAPTWIGLENYQEAFFQDAQFWASLRRTLYFALLNVTLGVAGSLGAALLLSQNYPGHDDVPDVLLPAVDHADHRLGAALGLDLPADDRRAQLPAQPGRD